MFSSPETRGPLPVATENCQSPESRFSLEKPLHRTETRWPTHHGPLPDFILLFPLQQLYHTVAEFPAPHSTSLLRLTSGTWMAPTNPRHLSPPPGAKRASQEAQVRDSGHQRLQGLCASRSTLDFHSRCYVRKRCQI